MAALLSLLASLLPVRAPLGLVAADGFLILLLMIDWLIAPTPSDIGVSRSLPPSLSLGETASLEWELTNSTKRRVRVGMADQLAPSLRPSARRVEVVLDGGAMIAVTTTLAPTRRGDFHPTEIVVRTHGPFGLAGRQARREVAERSRVLPSFASKREAELRMDRARILEVGLRSAQFRGSGTDFDQLRDYTPDDESRRIDWSATARAGRPIVKTFRAERNQVVLLLMDNGRLMAGRVGGVPRVEHAMDAVMTVTAVATKMSDRVGLVPFDREVRGMVPPGNSSGQMRRVVDAIYRLEPVLAETDYRGAFLETLTRFRRRALVVLLTELADQAMQETLFESLPLIMRRHLVVVGAVRDPQVEAWAEGNAAEAGTAYKKAAALDALEQRRRLASQLTRMGVAVIDAPPGRFAAQLADHYLQIKATGRL